MMLGMMSMQSTPHKCQIKQVFANIIISVKVCLTMVLGAVTGNEESHSLTPNKSHSVWDERGGLVFLFKMLVSLEKINLIYFDIIFPTAWLELSLHWQLANLFFLLLLYKISF